MNTSCTKITKKFLEMPLAIFFVDAVDSRSAPGYAEKIKKPMCLSKVLKKLQENKYNTIEKWKDDVNLVWNNAITYNNQGTPLHLIAKELKELFKIKTENIPHNVNEIWTKKIAKCHNELTQMLEFQSLLTDQLSQNTSNETLTI